MGAIPRKRNVKELVLGEGVVYGLLFRGAPRQTTRSFLSTPTRTLTLELRENGLANHLNDWVLLERERI